MDSFGNEIKQEFLAEARDLLSGTEQCFLNLEKNSSDPENLNLLFRLAHNLKGSSGAVGFADLADFTHELESLLLELKERRLAVTNQIVDLLLRCNDYLIHTVDLLRGDTTASYRNVELMNEIIEVRENPPVASPTENDTEENGPEENGPELIGISGLAVSKTQSKPKDENIRVSLSRIEALLNNVGELSILQAVMVQQSFAREVAMPPLMRDTMSAMSKIIKETQNISMSLRMLPIRQTFMKMERIVRDTSKALGKDVVLHLSGEDTEIDKTVIEQIADPLVHIVRNAIDHGLETSEERSQAGKPPVGHLSLSAFHRAGHVVIEVHEDGRGLDPDKLIQRAKAKGLLPLDAILTREQALQLIFLPGFSTKEEVTDLSGRGVGMDVVKTNIASLQGHIEIETEIGKGTCFCIYLPLTLAIVDSVVIRVGAERYVVPLAQVSEFFRPERKDIDSVHERSEILTIRSEPLPAVRLASLIGRGSQGAKPSWDLTALVVRDSSGGGVAVLVDQVIAQQQVVIKPLGQEVKGKAGIMGSAILGDGKPALILDLFELTRVACANGQQFSEKKKSMEAS